MDDLTISIIILAAWIIGAVAVHLRMRQLDRRRAHRARLRRIRSYCRSIQPDNVYELDPYSRKVS